MSQSILFIPVSHDVGAGEYYRCLNIALALREQTPSLAIHLCVNRAAQVARPDGLVYHDFERSPTSSNEEVVALLHSLRPAVVVLDCNARKHQLQACRRIGARTVFINDRPKKRLRGFQPGKLSLIDEHWIQGSRQVQHLKWYEKVILSMARRAPTVRFFTSFQQQPDPQRREAFLAQHGFRHRQYALFAPGGGGGLMDGQPTASVFQQAARQFEQTTGSPVIFVAGPLSKESLETTPDRLELQAVEPHTFMDLLEGAQLFVTGAGSQLWQGLALHKPAVAVPTTGHEQAQRLAGMVEEQVVIGAERTPESLAGQAVTLFNSPSRQQDMITWITACGYEDGTPQACQHLLDLCQKPWRTKP